MKRIGHTYLVSKALAQWSKTNMSITISPNRYAALKLYRANLHGTGWKIESGDYDAADAMLAHARKGAKKSRDYVMLDVLATAQADVNRLRDGVTPLT